MDHLLPRASVLYAVYPSHPDDAAELIETKAFLQSLADQDVLDNRRDDKLISWRASFKEGTSTDQLNDHKGIRIFEPEDAPLGQRSIGPRAPKKWAAWATDMNDIEQVKKTREWLDSKVEDKSLIQERREVPRRGVDRNKRKVKAWGYLTLDDAAVEEAKEHPGISAVEEIREIVDLKSAAETLSTVATKDSPDQLKNHKSIRTVELQDFSLGQRSIGPRTEEKKWIAFPTDYSNID